MSSDVWTDTVYDRLKALCQLPLSNALIAQKLTGEFGIIFTRNSVIGKRLRCGLSPPPRDKKASPPRRASTPRQPRIRFRAPRRETPTANGYHQEQILPTEFPHACGLLALKNNSCRYPCGEVGKPGFFFCGTPEANVIERRSYCIAHTWLVSRV